MKLICDQCGARYSIADEKVRGRVFKIRCKKCDNVIVVRGDTAVAPAQEQASPESAPVAQQQPAQAPPPEQVWYLLVGQQQVGPLAQAEVEAKVKVGEASGESYVWREGFGDWVQLKTLPEYASVLSATQAGSAPRHETPAAGLGGSLAPTAEPSVDHAAQPGSVGGDLFASAQNPSPMFPATAETPSALAPPPEDGIQLVGQRHENSVLFSLANLQNLASGGGEDGEATAPSEKSNTPASGLIDIRALSGDAEAPSGAPAPPPIVVPPIAAKPGISTGLLVGLIVSGLLVVVLLGLLVYVLMRQPAATVPGKERGPAVAAKHEAQPPKEEPHAKAPAKPKVASEQAAKPDAASRTQDAAKEEQVGAAADSSSDQPARVAARAPRRQARTRRATSRREPKKATPATARPQEEAKPRPRPVAPKPAAHTKPRRGGGKSEVDDLLASIEGGGAKPKPAAAPKAAAAEPKPAAAKPAQEKRPLTREDISRVVRAHKSMIKACYERQPEPKLSGTLMVTFTILRSGKVSSAAIKTAKFENTPVGRCVLSSVRSFKFPAHTDPPVKITYPFILR